MPITRATSFHPVMIDGDEIMLNLATEPDDENHPGVDFILTRDDLRNLLRAMDKAKGDE